MPVFLSGCAVSNLHGANLLGFPKEFFPGGKRLCIELLMGVSAFVSRYHLNGLETQIYLQGNNYAKL